MHDKKEADTGGMSELYRFLAQTMRYPAPSWMGREFLGSFFQIAEKIPQMPDCKPCMALFYEEEGWLEKLRTEYTRLFINAHPHVIAPPYGAIYLDSDIGGQTRFMEETSRFYQRKGFELIDQERPDWLVHELEFMALLAAEDQAGLEAFLAGYFRPWFPRFREKVATQTSHPYFVLANHMIDFFTV